MQRSQLFLHVGTHKTGTTTIQNTLIDNTENLKNENIYYLGKYKPDIIEISENNNLSPEVIDSLKKEICEDITELNEKPNRKFIITNEKLAGDKKIGYKNAETVASVLKKILQNLDLDIKVIIYFRRQDDFLESLYSQRIYNGSPLTFDQFLNSFDEDSFCWENVADSYARHFGQTNIIVRRYHKQYLPYLDSLVHDFGEIIDSRILKEFVGKRTFNMGFTNSALRLIKLLTPHLEENELISIKKLLRKGLQKNTFEKYTLLDQHQRNEILNRYKESNKAVLKKYIDSESGNLFPEMEEEYKTDFKEGVTQKEMAVNFAVALHHLYEKSNRFEKRIKELEKKKTYTEIFFNKIRKTFFG